MATGEMAIYAGETRPILSRPAEVVGWRAAREVSCPEASIKEEVAQWQQQQKQQTSR
jgi:hypothetical protein